MITEGFMQTSSIFINKYCGICGLLTLKTGFMISFVEIRYEMTLQDVFESLFPYERRNHYTVSVQ